MFVGVYRRPSPHGLVLGLAAITLVAFVCLTTMHERYAYPAFVFLLMAVPRPSVAIAWAVFAVVFALNLVVAIPPEGWTIPMARELGLIGGVVMTMLMGVVVALVAAGGRREPLETWEPSRAS